jgi:hypothetical protein
VGPLQGRKLWIFSSTRSLFAEQDLTRLDFSLSAAADEAGGRDRVGAQLRPSFAAR